MSAKADVREFWDRRSCGEVYTAGSDLGQRLASQAAERYRLEPYIAGFAQFAEAAGKDVLEIGVGMGADHLEWAKARPRWLAGIDLTPRAVSYTRSRLQLYGFEPRVEVGDAEHLPFSAGSFDLVYSWGVLHHSPDTGRAVQEVHRVLRPGGVARIMIYHQPSLVGDLLWLRYAFVTGKWRTSRTTIHAERLESPGTKAYTLAQARALFAPFANVRMRVELSPGDLLAGEAGQRHQGLLLNVMRRVWPRWLLKRLFRPRGLFLLIEARK